jgi:tRNA(adenine34) deaminase
VAKTTPLLRARRGNSSEGSNPSHSATFLPLTIMTTHTKNRPIEKTIFSQNDEAFMKEALSLAKIARDQGETPVGAVLVDGHEKILSKTYNLRETSNSAIAHAEVLAIEEACKKLGRWRLHDCTLYVTLEPCFMCAGAIILSRIPRVVFAATDPKAGAVISLANVLTDSRLNHQCLINYGIHESEASQLLKDFFKARRK